jgi:hypothetical protein
MDGVGVKNMTFINNNTAVRTFSSNMSNWNVMNVNVQANVPSAVGWDQTVGGNSLQTVKCAGTATNPITDCVRIEMATSYLTDLRRLRRSRMR